MRPLSERIGQEMEWECTSFWGTCWELRAGSEVMAKVSRVKWWSERMVATLEARSYRVATNWRSHLRVFDADRARDPHAAPLLVYVPIGLRRDEAAKRAGLGASLQQGRLMRGGQLVAWVRRPRFFGRSYELVDPAGQVLANFETLGGAFRVCRQVRVTIAARARGLEGLSLLVMLAGWAVICGRRPKSS